MSLENVPRCQHIKVNGTQCGSPALRRRRHCYFHDCVARQQRKIAADNTAPCRFALPLLEDANSVQTALMKVIQMLGSGRMDHKTAGLMLYALQTASVNLRYTDLEHRDVTEIVIDRDTVHATCINGNQWFAEDFDEETEEQEEETEEDDTEEEEAEDEEEDSQSQDAEAESEAAETDAQAAQPDAVTGASAPAESASPAPASSEKKKPQSVRKGAREHKHIDVEEARKGAKAIARQWLLETLSKPAG